MTIIKSLTAREVFRRVASVKAQLWVGAFCSSGYYANTIGRHGSEATLRAYIAGQGRQSEYRQMHTQQMHTQQMHTQQMHTQQLDLFE